MLQKRKHILSYSIIGDPATSDLGPADLEDSSQGAMMKAFKFFNFFRWGSSICSLRGGRKEGLRCILDASLRCLHLWSQRSALLCQ
jgi:hypothetical protein